MERAAVSILRVASVLRLFDPSCPNLRFLGLFRPAVSPSLHPDALTAMQSLTTKTPLGNTHWNVRADLSNALIGPQGFRFAEWRKAGLLETVKSGPHRTVYRLSCDAGCFFLKHYRVSDLRALLQNVVRPSRAIREWMAARQIAALGISTIETVAIGRTKRFGLTLDSYLACPAIDNTESLDTFVLQRLTQLPPSRCRTIRRHLAREMGRLVATLHQGGIIHRDLHAENILVQLQPDDSVRLSLIDLHAVSIGRRMTFRRIERNLAMLNPALVHHLTRIDRLRFFRSYWRELHVQPTRSKSLSKQVAAVSRRMLSNRIAGFCNRDLVRVERKRDKKWAHGNRRLIIADSKKIRCRGLAGLGRDQLISLRDTLLPSIDMPRGDSGAGDLRQQIQTIPVQLGGQPLQCRLETQELPAIPDWRRLLGARSAAQQAWELGHACLRRNIPVARPIAFIEKVNDKRSLQVVLIEQRQNAVSLEYILAQHPQPSNAVNGIRRIAITLAQVVRRLHAAGMDYEDLGTNSVLVDWSDSDSRIWLASPANVHRRRPKPVRTLAQLYSSVSCDCRFRLSLALRFLKHYLAERFDADWKSFWRSIRQQVTVAPMHDSTNTPLRRSA